MPSGKQNVSTTQLCMQLDSGRKRSLWLSVQEKCAAANPIHSNERYHLEIGQEGAASCVQGTDGAVDVRRQKKPDGATWCDAVPMDDRQAFGMGRHRTRHSQTCTLMTRPRQQQRLLTERLYRQRPNTPIGQGSPLLAHRSHDWWCLE